MSSRLIFLPSAPTRRADEGAPASVLRCATIDQYSRETNFSISSSRSQTMPQRHRLHPPRRARAGQLAPQHRREREADEVVERAARPVGVDQRLVDLARMAHRLLHRVLGDGVEHDAVDALVLEQLLVLEDLVDVPGDRLALAVRVGRQDHPLGVLDRAADVAHAAWRTWRRPPSAWRNRRPDRPSRPWRSDRARARTRRRPRNPCPDIC